jgi:membrane-bound lytic murein transglycosylase D
MLKKIFITFVCQIAWLSSNSQTLPPVPKRITMFDMNITLEDDTRKTIEKEMAFLASKRVYVDAKLAKMAIYFPIIETIFEQEGVPKEFKYLCAQESSFIADAVSTSNAVGFWQFKSGTATDFGLRVDDVIDERKNIIASTRAAAQYLKNNNKTYKNWVATLLSYRLGLTGAKNQIPGNWIGATEITVGNNIDWYVIRNIAHFIYFENELEHFEPNGSYYYLYNRAAGKSFADIAQEIQVDELTLKKENLWCSTDIIPRDKNYTVVSLIKKDRVMPVLAAQQNVLNKPFFDIEVGYPVLKKNEKKSKKEKEMFYTINDKDGILSQAGDTPDKLADRAGLKLQYFMSYNDLDKSDAIKPQMVYYLERKNRKADTEFHTVKKGQNLWLISQMYGVKEKRVLRMNRMKKDEPLQEGRVMYLKAKRPRKKEIEFIRMPQENKQLPTEIQPVIIENTNNTYPNKPIVPEKTIETIPQTETTVSEITSIQENPVTYQGASPLKVIVRDKSDQPEIERKTTNNVATNEIIVKPGETLYSISKKHGVSVDDLKKANNLGDSNIETGKKIIVSVNKGVVNSEFNVLSKPKTGTVSTKQNFHVVQTGETLYRVSKIYNVSVENLKTINNLSDNTISVGQRLALSK